MFYSFKFLISLFANGE